MPDEQKMHGFLLIDKPADVPSFRCVAVLRRLTGIRRIGFAGTLDPLATGLMILAIGRESTRELGNLSKLDKVYEVLIELGKVSDTYDAKGKISVPLFSNGTLLGNSALPSNGEHAAEPPTLSNIKKLLKENFEGEQMQMPPIYSAIQIGGKRAYALARQNKEVKLELRRVNFYETEVLSFEWPQLRLRVHCSSGTYIRSLAHDLGQLLQCGGYVKELRRLKVGEFSVSDAIKLEDLTLEKVVQGLRIKL